MIVLQTGGRQEVSMKTIYIIGFMGAGKTTVGQALSKVLRLPVIDTDQQVEKRRGKVIRDIFAEEGEVAFREYEREVLQSLSTPNTIVTTGGGIVENESNRQWMKDNGIIIYLYCDPSVIVERLRDDITRPLFQRENTRAFIEKFKKREPFYEEATIKINTTNKKIEDIVREIEQKVNE